MMTPRAAAIYCRISSDPEGLRLGVTRQEEDCRALAKRLGWEIAEVYVENDTSASKGKKRPVFSRMQADCESGLRDGILVYNCDRLTRRLVELATFLDWRERHGIAMATTEGDDTTTANGRMVVEIKGVVAQQEARRISERVARSHLQLAQAGKLSGGGTRPYGYEKDRLTIKEDEAAVIRESTQRVIAGESISSICRDLDARGSKTISGNRWTHSTLKNIICRPRIAGLRVYKEAVILDASGEPITAVWPGILDRDTWQTVRDILCDPARKAISSRIDRKYLLSGFLRCRCGAKMYGVTKSGKFVYQCPYTMGCNKTNRRGLSLDAHITELVLRYLEREQVEADPEPVTDPLEAQVDTAQAALSALIAEWDAGRMSDAVFFTAQATKEATLLALKRQRTTKRRRAAIDTTNVREVWAKANISQQRAIISEVLVAIAVLPKPVHAPKTFDPQYYKPLWREDWNEDGDDEMVSTVAQ